MHKTAMHTPSDALLLGDSLQLLKSFEADSIDLVCTDPPYGIGFQGHAWDTFAPTFVTDTTRSTRRRSGADTMANAGWTAGRYRRGARSNRAFQEFITQIGRELLRVMKPGAFLFMAMTPRQDSLARVVIALEDAGFSMGFTSLYWTFASGFPKAHNIAKAVDAREGAVREVVGTRTLNDIRGGRYGSSRGKVVAPILGGAVSARAKKLEGSYGGFQPKPAVEIVIVAMKPLSQKTYTDQALTNRKGITWLDDARIPGEAVTIHGAPPGSFAGGAAGRGSHKDYRPNDQGRFPANLVVGNDVLGECSKYFSLDAWADKTLPFLIVPKASVCEKNLKTRPNGNPFTPYASKTFHAAGNTHPTVKPLKLMTYLVALGSRPGDLVLDPFLGSGTTAVAAKLLGRRYIGIERESRYLAIARRRVATC